MVTMNITHENNLAVILKPFPEIFEGILTPLDRVLIPIMTWKSRTKHKQIRCEKPGSIGEERSKLFFNPSAMEEQERERRERPKEAIGENSSSYSPGSQKGVLFQWDHRHLYIGLGGGASPCVRKVMCQATHYSKFHTHRDL